VMRLVYCLSMIFCLAHSVQAGPWLREQGSSFTSVSVTGNFALDTTSQTFIEYGFTDHTTLIANVTLRRPRFDLEGGAATVSFRHAISVPEGPSKWAYELGVGASWTGTEVSPHLRTGLSWGRGMELSGTSGWMTVEGELIWDLLYGLHVAKIDTTAGLNLTDRTSAMLQIYTGHTALTSTATIAPSLVFTPKNGAFRIQIGTESLLGDFSNSAVKIGLWRTF